MATDPRQAGQEATASYCNWHPETETRLSCSHCGKSICTVCLVQAPVGIRCRECGRPERLPTYDVQPSYYARAIGVGIAVAIVGGLAVVCRRCLAVAGRSFCERIYQSCDSLRGQRADQPFREYETGNRAGVDCGMLRWRGLPDLHYCRPAVQRLGCVAGVHCRICGGVPGSLIN